MNKRYTVSCDPTMKGFSSPLGPSRETVLASRAAVHCSPPAGHPRATANQEQPV